MTFDNLVVVFIELYYCTPINVNSCLFKLILIQMSSDHRCTYDLCKISSLKLIIYLAVMEEGHICLIDGDSDVLHCGFNYALNEGGKRYFEYKLFYCTDNFNLLFRYPSADHYANAMILSSLGLDEGLILELLATPSSVVARKAREILRDNIPTGCDLNSLQQYMISSRQSYTMQGLRLRAEQDKSVLFEFCC